MGSRLKKPDPNIVAYPSLRPFGDEQDVALGIREVDLQAGEDVNSKARDRLSEQIGATLHGRPLLQFSMEAECVRASRSPSSLTPPISSYEADETVALIQHERAALRQAGDLPGARATSPRPERRDQSPPHPIDHLPVEQSRSRPMKRTVAAKDDAVNADPSRRRQRHETAPSAPVAPPIVTRISFTLGLILFASILQSHDGSRISRGIMSIHAFLPPFALPRSKSVGCDAPSERRGGAGRLVGFPSGRRGDAIFENNFSLTICFKKIRSRVMVFLVAGSSRAWRAESSGRFQPSRGRVDTLKSGEGREVLSSRHGLGWRHAFGLKPKSVQRRQCRDVLAKPIRLPVLSPRLREDDPGAKRSSRVPRGKAVAEFAPNGAASD